MREESKVIDAIHDLVLKHTDLNVWVTTGTLRSTRVTKARAVGMIVMRRAGIRPTRIAEEYNCTPSAVTQLIQSRSRDPIVVERSSEILDVVNRDFRIGPRVWFDHIVEAAIEEIGCTRPELVDGSQKALAVLARRCVVYLAREMTSMSYLEIAKAMNSRMESHSTYTSCYRDMVRLIDEDHKILVRETELSAVDWIALVRARVMNMMEAAA